MAVNQYIKDTVSEMKHVSWPTRRQAIMFTILVIVISIIVAAYVGVLDSFFTKLLKLMVNSQSAAPITPTDLNGISATSTFTGTSTATSTPAAPLLQI